MASVVRESVTFWVYRQPGVRYHMNANCFGILDYIYGTWFGCRQCGRWVNIKW